MKKISTLFTLLLLVSHVYGQADLIAKENFNGALSTFTKGTHISNVTVNGSDGDNCAGQTDKGRVLPSALGPQTITIVVTPDANYAVDVFTLKMELQLSGGAPATAVVNVNGVQLVTSKPIVAGCNTLIFTSLPLSPAPALLAASSAASSAAATTIDIIVSGYAGSQSLIFDEIEMLGTIALAALPVELAKFNVKKAEQSVMLSWATASEKNNDRFEIQKSTNGTSFQTIGQVKGNGTSLTGATYNFEDKNPSVGIAYYRLKQVDLGGGHEFSTVRSILFGKSKLTVFSTVAKEKINITVSDDQIVPFDIINLNGQKVLAGKAIGQHTIDVSGLHSGMYFIRTEGGEVTRFVKE